jgi:AraC-like DNA-binding protein
MLEQAGVQERMAILNIIWHCGYRHSSQSHRAFSDLCSGVPCHEAKVQHRLAIMGLSEGM